MSEFRGHLHVEAARDPAGRTKLARQSFRAPFHLSKPYWDADAGVLRVQVVNPTAGMLEGDRLETEVRVDSGASLLVTTPSHARAFRTATGGHVRCEQHLCVAAGGWLDWFPEPLVPHAGSAYEQLTRIELEMGARMFFCDAMGPGRAARGESWAWRSLAMHLSVSQSGRPILRERFAGSGEEIAKLARWGQKTESWLATIVVAGAELDEAQRRAIHALQCDELSVGGSALPGVAAWSFRLVARDGQCLRDGMVALRTILAGAWPELGVNLRRV